MSEIITMIENVRVKQPLVHNITNQVVVNFTANGLYALGAAPVMANAVEEAGDMASIADALSINIGTLTPVQVEAMIVAGRAANEKGIPVVLDPVGVGATPFRTKAAKEILNKVDVSIIRGNAGEISHLAGLDAQMKGVDSASSGNNNEIAKYAVKQLGVPVIVTGKKDVITDGKACYEINNGHTLLTSVTGAGCLLSSVVAAFLATGRETVSAAAAAVGFYGVAAEVAAKNSDGPGSFQIALLDALYQVKSEDIRKLLNIEHKIMVEKEQTK